MSGRTRLALVATLVGGALVAGQAIEPARAQPADAIGQPLADEKLEARTVVVRVIAGDRDKPVTGSDVTLRIVPPDGSATVERVARTDAHGRASFVDLPSGAVVTAAVTGPGGEQASTGFPVPATGGTRLLLSTVPMAGSATTAGAPGAPSSAGGARPMAGPMAGGQPQPRMMSGRPRPQGGDPGDTLTVRLTYDDLVDPRPPGDHPVLLIAYRYDHQVTARVTRTDPVGRAVFGGLDRSGATSYFAMATLPRGATRDRLTSGPILMVADDGQRLILSAEKRASDKPAVDDLSSLSPQPPQPVAPGTVDVVLAGVPEDGAPVELVDATTGAVVATARAGAPLPAAGTGTATWKPVGEEPSLAPGTVEVSVTLDGQPAPGMAVEARRKAPAAPSPTAPARGPVAPPPAAPTTITAVTDAGGKAVLTGLTPGEQVELVVVTPAGPATPSTVTVPARGGARAAAEVSWKELGQAGAHLTGAVAADDRAFYVRSRMHGQLNLSPPFQLTADRGALIPVVAMPRVMLSFSLTSWVEDEYLAASGTWTVSNSSWAPYLATKDDRPTELVIPIPSGATGLQVRDDAAAMVGTDPKRGYIIRRPLPPGGFDFPAGFSMKIHDGTVAWDMPLPLGSFESGIELLRPNSMTRVTLPEGTKATVEEATDTRGKFWVLSPITILPPQRMVFSVTGLPQPAAWTWWSKLAIGVATLIILLGGVGLALHRGSAAAAHDATRARYDRLLDELAAIEAEPGQEVRKAELRADLEALRERLDQAGAGEGKPAADQAGG